jgi:hypothetical protein
MNLSPGLGSCRVANQKARARLSWPLAYPIWDLGVGIMFWLHDAPTYRVEGHFWQNPARVRECLNPDEKIHALSTSHPASQYSGFLANGAISGTALGLFRRTVHCPPSTTGIYGQPGLDTCFSYSDTAIRISLKHGAPRPCSLSEPTLSQQSMRS